MIYLATALDRPFGIPKCPVHGPVSKDRIHLPLNENE